MTDTDREYIGGGEDVDSHKRYQAISRVRSRINEELATDVEVLAKHHPDLLDELREVVCSDAPDGLEGEKIRDGAPDDGAGRDVDESGADRSAVEAAIADVEFPSGRDRAECVAAVEAAHAHLQREGAATRGEFVREVMPEHPVGYDVPQLDEGERYRGAWWRKVVKPGLEALPDVEKPPKGGSDWTYVGDRDD